jgi:[ribosomal protein S18]-alanine N-acetyltransferase
MVLGPALPAERFALAALHARCFDPGWSEQTFADFIADGKVVVAREGTQCLACLILQAVGDEAEIISIFVEPGSQGRGLATRLLEEGPALVPHSQPIRTLFLEVRRDNASAIGLYEHLRFAQIGVRKDYYRLADGTFVDALVLSRSLA